MRRESPLETQIFEAITYRRYDKMWDFYVRERATFLSIIPRSHSIWMDNPTDFTWRTQICMEDQPAFAEQALRRVSIYDLDSHPVQVAKLYPAAESRVYNWISDRYARARKIEKSSRHPYSHNVSEVDHAVTYFRTFVDQFPQYGTRTLTRLIRDGNWKRVADLAHGRYVDWKPHVPTMVRGLEDKILPREVLDSLMTCSNLWREYLDGFFRGKNRSAGVSYFAAVRCIPWESSTHYQELAFKKGYPQLAESIARMHPGTSGPGRTLINVHNAHAM